jgi:hypothetical protein
MVNNFSFMHGAGGVHYEGIGTVYKNNRGIRGFGAADFQHGCGFGSFVRNLIGRAIPFFRKRVIPAMTPLLEHAKETIQDAAANVVEDAVQGENIGESIKRNVTSEGKKLLAKVPEAFAGMLGRNKTTNKVSPNPTTRQATPATRRRKRTSNISRIPTKRGRGSTSKFPGLALLN